jgi:hypothetical protein
MRLVLVSMLAAAALVMAGCGNDEEGGGTLYCCMLDLLCHQSPTIELAPCLTDMTIMDAASAGKESDCKRMIDNNVLDVHKYSCDPAGGHSEDCYFEESDAREQCE